MNLLSQNLLRELFEVTNFATQFDTIRNCVRIEACSLSTAIREHKENIHVVLEVWCTPVFPPYANKLFWFSGVLRLCQKQFSQ